MAKKKFKLKGKCPCPDKVAKRLGLTKRVMNKIKKCINSIFKS